MRFAYLGVVTATLLAFSASAQTLSNGQTVGEAIVSSVEKRTAKEYARNHEGIAVGEPHPDDPEHIKKREKKKWDRDGKHGKNHYKYKNKEKNAGHGKRLPPGIAKNLERGKPLPPGIAKRDVPADIEKRLPPLGQNQKRVVVGNDIVLIDTATNVVIDILAGVL